MDKCVPLALICDSIISAYEQFTQIAAARSVAGSALMDLRDVRRLLWVHAEEYLERQPAEFRQEARDLYAQGKYEITTKIVEDRVLPDSGLYYVLSVLPDGRLPSEPLQPALAQARPRPQRATRHLRRGSS
jgi:hypothetical protein